MTQQTATAPHQFGEGGEVFIENAARAAAFHAEHGRLHRLDGGQQVAAGFGQAVSAGLAGEQRFAHLFLQGLDAAGDGRVLDTRAPRGGGQRASTGQFQKIAEVLPIHRERSSLRGVDCVVQIRKAHVRFSSIDLAISHG